MLQTKVIEYTEGATKLFGHCVFDDAFKGNRPAVLIAHDWSGCNDFSRQKAKMLAELGYIGFAVDMYGEGRVGSNKDENYALMKPLLDDRELLAKRVNAAFNTLKSLDYVDETRIAAIGYCFGGLCALDLARSGADVIGVVSFHGGLLPPPFPSSQSIKAKMLILHGYEDPRVSLSEVNAFETEMTAARVDWQLIVYSQTMHSFTNPKANDPSFGTVYNPVADKRSWLAMKNFLFEVFGA